MTTGNKGLPPHQKPMKRILKWGKEHPTSAGPVPKIDLKNWSLTVDGEVERPLKLSWNDFLRLAAVESTSDFHCVEGWSIAGCKWEGIRLKHIAEMARPKKTAKFATFECADGYTTSLSLNELSGDNVILAFKLDGSYLEEGIGGPVRLIIPDKYAYKSAMWVTRVRLTCEKELGYWEVRGYSDSADVWKDDRYSKQGKKR